MEKQVFFYSDCLKLSGKFYTPENYTEGEKRPGIICMHGYSGRMNVYMPPFTKRLIEKGYVVFAFFHRGFGDSEGMRTRIIPMEQVRDILHAITFIQQCPEVDPERIGLLGLSFGGATAIYAAALDQRARCVVEIGALADGERWARDKRTYWQWLEFTDELREDRIRRVMTGQSKRVPYVELCPPGPEMSKVFKSTIRPEEQYPEGYPLENVDETLTFKPESQVHLISPRPVLFIHAERDAMAAVDGARSMYANAGEPKKLVIIPGINHAEVYEPVNPEAFKIVIKETLEWFGNYLK